MPESYLKKTQKDSLAKNWKINKDLQNVKFDYEASDEKYYNKTTTTPRILFKDKY